MFRTPRPAWSLVSVIAMVALVLGAAGVVPVDAQPVSQRTGISWRMEPRFGIDADRDGRIEIENIHAHVNGRHSPCDGECPLQRFRVGLRALPGLVDDGVGARLLSYEWRIEGPAGRATHLGSNPELNLLLPEGWHDIDLRVRIQLPWGAVTLRQRHTIEVEDIVVVALGDSYISGEGNPDVPLVGDVEAIWADSSDPAVEASHALAHRSSVGWGPQVAMALEVGDPHSSVTFIDLAASGARISAGLLGSHGALDLPAQLDDLERILGDRRIDVLLLQIGGNDIGFPQVVRQLVEADPLLDPVCYDQMLDNVWASVRDGRWDREVSLGYEPPLRIVCRSSGGQVASRPGLDGLAAEFDRLAASLSRFDIGRVLLVEYPDPSGSEADAGTCPEIVGDTTPPFRFHEIDAREQALGMERVLAPLNDELSAAANRHGWDFVGQVAESFAAGHGYCGPWPDYGYPAEFHESPFLFRDRLDHPEGWYRPPGPFGAPLLMTRGEVSWYRTAAQSAVLQGPSPRFLTPGTLHPNELGHAAIARLVLAVLGDDD